MASNFDDADGNQKIIDGECSECQWIDDHAPYCETGRKIELSYMQKCEDFRDNLALEFAKNVMKKDHMEVVDFMKNIGIWSYQFADAMIAGKLGEK